MKERVIPSLTKRGWIKGGVVDKADFILAYFFETLPSQSWMFRTDTTSIQDILADNPNDPDGFINEVQSRLEEKFSLYFDKTIITVEYANYDEYRRTGKAEINISIIIHEAGTEVKLDREFRNIKGVFQAVVKEVNYGTDQ